KGFEQLGEAPLLLSLLGDIARQNARAHHFVALYDGVHHAVEIEQACAVLQLDLNNPRPSPFLEEAANTHFDLTSGWDIAEFVEFVSNDLGVLQVYKVG